MLKSTIVLASLLTYVHGHGLISVVSGDNGVTTRGFGVTTTVPRNGTSEQPFQLDTPVMKNLVDDPCGATLQGGSINIQDSLALAVQQGGGDLPSLSPNGSITMTIHQVNSDGGGPFSAQINLDATGKTWVDAIVTQQVPGSNGILRGGPVDSQFTAQVPEGTVCTGGDTGNVCLIRINNGGAGLEDSLANGAGPFGGCAAVINNAATTATTGTATSANANTNTNANTNANTNTNQGTNGRGGRGRNRNNFNNRRSLSRRTAELRELLAKRQELDEEIEMKRQELVERQFLTIDLIDELKTATGSAIDIPIDAFAGQKDDLPDGGNSTTSRGAILTHQQAVDLKKAVQGAIADALAVMSSAQNVSVDAAGFTVANKLTAEQIAQANAEAAKALADGSTTSVNQGNAGVGEPNTAVVESLLGGASAVAATLTDIGAAIPTNTAIAVTTQAAGTAAGQAAPTATAASSGRGRGRNRFGNNRNAVNKRALRSRIARYVEDLE